MKPIESLTPNATIRQALRWGEAQIKLGIGVSTANLDARCLMTHCLQVDNYSSLLLREAETLTPAASQQFSSAIAKRHSGVPIAYIIGWREFYGRRFKTSPAALIPRCETELLVETALHHIPADGAANVLDLGTGCGAIAVSVAKHRPNASVYATDCEAAVLQLAKQNAAHYRANNVTFLQADWYEGVPASLKFDVIVSNPPYIAADDPHLGQGDVRFEPKVALVGGRDGLDALSQIARHAPQHLKRGGVIMMENGHNQALEVAGRLADAGFCGIQQLPDLAGYARLNLGFLP